MVTLEASGVSTIVLCTTAFSAAAAEQWLALGFAAGSTVAVAHPLGTMPRERVLEEAEQALGAVQELLLRRGGGDDGTAAGAAGRRPVA